MEQRYFSPFPFGTDLNKDDIELAGSLKALKSLSNGYPLKIAKGMLLELFRPIPKGIEHHLERLDLLKPSGIKEKMYRKTVVLALRNNGLLG